MLICSHFMKKLNTEDTADYLGGPRVPEQLCILIF